MRHIVRLALAATMVATAVPGLAQTFPARPITMVVPLAAGGPSDAIARLVAQSMSGKLGQKVIIENFACEVGSIVVERGANAE